MRVDVKLGSTAMVGIRAYFMDADYVIPRSRRHGGEAPGSRFPSSQGRNARWLQVPFTGVDKLLDKPAVVSIDEAALIDTIAHKRLSFTTGAFEVQADLASTEAHNSTSTPN